MSDQNRNQNSRFMINAILRPWYNSFPPNSGFVDKSFLCFHLSYDLQNIMRRS